MLEKKKKKYLKYKVRLILSEKSSMKNYYNTMEIVKCKKSG